ncbi:MAG: nucleotidyltransferase domain-containing protein [Candidatus Helarchaeota archaeon]
MEIQLEDILSKVVDTLKRNYKPLKIILFGSYAYGNPKENSDIDILIIKNTVKRRVDRIVLVKKLIYNPNRKIPISPIVYTPDELNERLRIGDDFIQEIIEKGIILYEKKIGK